MHIGESKQLVSWLKNAKCDYSV